MLQTNSTFDTYIAQGSRSPIFLVHFDGETIDFANGIVQNPTNTVKTYLDSISGGSQRVTPDQGQASIGAHTIQILDVDDEITALIATDSYYFHRRKTTISLGFAGMNQADFVTVATGWVTGMKLVKDLGMWQFEITDPQKWLQRSIFRGTDDDPLHLSGNPIRIALQVITSTGAGTNGDYDTLSAGNGIGLDVALIDIAGIEQMWAEWFTGVRFDFVIEGKETAKKWLEKEIFKVLNIYPGVDGSGRFSMRPMKPILVGRSSLVGLTSDNMLKLPTYDMNLSALINELETSYDYSAATDKFISLDYHLETDSINNRGPGNDVLEIKSKGIESDYNGTELMAERARRIFQRYAVPPIKIQAEGDISLMINEAGDVIPIDCELLPDWPTGQRGLAGENLEIITRAVDYAAGKVKFDLLGTGFGQQTFCVISPEMVITAGINAYSFTVSAADAAKFQEGWEINILKKNMMPADATERQTIYDITGTTITIQPGLSATPSAGWICVFADFRYLTDYQQLYWALADEDGAGWLLADTSDVPNSLFNTYTGTQDDGNSDTFNNWYHSNIYDPVGDKAEATATAQSAPNAVKITRTTASYCGIYTDIEIIKGAWYRLSIYTRGDGTHALLYRIQGVGGADPAVTVIDWTNTGKTGTSYSNYRVYFQMPNTREYMRIQFSTEFGGVAYVDNVYVHEVKKEMLLVA